MKKDEIITLHGQPLGKKDFMGAVDQVIITLHDTGDVNRVMNVINGLDAIDNVAGHAKAKLLYATNEWWRQNKPNEEFGDHVESTTTTRKVTVDRYVLTWKYVEDLVIPKEIAERPMRDLVPIAKAVQYMKLHDKDLSKKDWQKISTTSNSAELSSVLQEIKGKKPKKNTKVIKLSRDGSLNLWKNNVKKFVGFLNIKEAETDIEIAEAIEKIIVSTGIVKE